MGLPLPAPLELALRLGFPLIGAAAWGLEQAGLIMTKSIRFFSGILLGLGLGWVLGRHISTAWPRELVELGVALTVILALGIIAKWRGEHEEALPVTALLDASPPEVGKKTDSAAKNEVDPKAS